ncbi:glycosyltransferase family 4 protein [Pseudorhizobium flavum]|uniref:Glycosyltransferase involved in cell wall biosynthesis n=1 Tax=Pseudorhizobium flavum TaxID=1335061 RepID=A0A7W9Z1I5_9HYPH|nr:glycosyltransferase family 4 protein [Pseudorhizobium flavum]MBB6182348.1 glycosyltransferase involved in cell wall biosynthesis [Pseudorhizobium flavum]CAD6632029.1 glycosyltransferase family 1 protein [Pseudorhizobium flavum]
MPSTDNQHPIRVLFLQTQAELAGAQEISRILAEQLSEISLNGKLIFETHHVFLYRKTSGCDHFQNVHFAALERPSSLHSGLELIKTLAKIMREVRPDVLLTFQHYGNIVGAPLGRIFGVPQIIANHVSAPLTIKGPVRLLDRLLGLFGAYDVITVNSAATWNDYKTYPMRYRRRLIHVPHGFTPRSGTLSKKEAKRALGVTEFGPLIGTVARLHPLKQIDLAIRTLPILANVNLVVAGQGPDAERLSRVAEDLGVRDRVHFVGEIAPEEIGTFLAALDLFVFPSAAETFGLAAVEAAQAGIPVVANDLAVLREVLEWDQHPCALFVDTADTASFAQAINELLSDQQLRDELARRGRQLSERYSVDTMVKGYLRLILGAHSLKKRLNPDELKQHELWHE